MPMASPMTKTIAWSAIVPGSVRKKKASVRWKSEMEVMIVRAEMSAMVGGSLCSFRGSYGCRCPVGFGSQRWCRELGVSTGASARVLVIVLEDAKFGMPSWGKGEKRKK